MHEVERPTCVHPRHDRDRRTHAHRAAAALPAPEVGEAKPRDYAGVLVPLELQTPIGRLVLFSTVTVFGTPVDVTLSELALEAFYPADEETGALLRRMAEAA